MLQCIPGKGNLANYAVFDQGIFDTFFGTTDEGRAMFEDAVAGDKTETLFKADSIKGLADACGLDADGLTKTVARYEEGQRRRLRQAGREDGRHRERAVLPG